MILTQEQEMIRDAMRAFAQERLAPFAAEWDRRHTFPAEALRELGALGAAIAAAVAIGHYPDYASAVRAMTDSARRYEPDPSLSGIYQQKFSRYLATATALASIP